MRFDIKIVQLFAPLLSIFIIINGLGALSTHIPLVIDQLYTSGFEVGVITGVYYLGMTVGAFRNADLITRVGHIRTYTALAAIIVTVILGMGISQNIFVWGVSRFLTGYCLAGLYIVIESWILAAGTPKTRGTLLSLYMIAIYSASGSGQFLLKITPNDPAFIFTIAAILSSLSIVPLAITKASTVVIDEPSALPVKKLFKISPSGMISCGFSGILFGVISGFIPIYLNNKLDNAMDTPFVMFLVLMGGVILQFPIGWLSDQFDRRKMLILLSVSIIVIGAVMMLPITLPKIVFYALMFSFGGVSFSLYPVSMSHTCDPLDAEDIVTATQGLMLVYGTGAVLGPLVAPIFQSVYGYEGIFLYFTVFSTALLFYLLRRLYVSDPNEAEDQHDFVPMPNTTPIASELDPRVDDE